MTHQELWQAFEAHLTAQNYAINTIHAYRRDVNQFLQFLEEQYLPLDALTIAHATQFFTTLTQQGIAPSSRARKLNALRGFLAFLVQRGDIPANPFALMKAPKIDTKQMRVLKEVEYRRLRDVIRERSIRDYAIVELVLQTGLRASEVCHLRFPRDIEFSSKTVHASVTIRESKSRHARLVPLNSVAEKALRHYLNVRAKEADTDHLFLTNRKTQMTRSLLHRMLKRYFALAGIEDVSFHTLRHTFATHSIHKGTNLLVVQETLGHKHLTTTEKYLHFIRERQVEELEKNAL